MAGRTWLQQATPTTFGLKAAGWLDALEPRAARRSRPRSRTRSCCSSAARPARWPRSARAGRPSPQRSARGWSLPVPALPWHAHRDRLARLACALGVATGTLGKIARDLALLAQTEVGEAHERRGGRGGSSTMPHKRNPVRAAVALAAAVRAPGLVATMLAAMPQEHERGLGGWQAEWDTMPELVGVAADAARAMAEALEGLVVDAARMRANLDITRGLVLAEAVVMRLAPQLGKSDAHARVEAASRRVVAEGRSLADVLAEDPAVTAVLDRGAIEAALAPENYLGCARTFVENVLGRRGKA